MKPYGTHGDVGNVLGFEDQKLCIQQLKNWESSNKFGETNMVDSTNDVVFSGILDSGDCLKVLKGDKTLDVEN